MQLISRRRASFQFLIGPFAVAALLLSVNFKNYFSLKIITPRLVVQAVNANAQHRTPNENSKQSTPIDNEEDEDNDSDDKIELSIIEIHSEISTVCSYLFWQDQLFSDPQVETLCPPPKA